MAAEASSGGIEELLSVLSDALGWKVEHLGHVDGALGGGDTVRIRVPDGGEGHEVTRSAGDHGLAVCRGALRAAEISSMTGPDVGE